MVPGPGRDRYGFRTKGTPQRHIMYRHPFARQAEPKMFRHFSKYGTYPLTVQSKYLKRTRMRKENLKYKKFRIRRSNWQRKLSYLIFRRNLGYKVNIRAHMRAKPSPSFFKARLKDNNYRFSRPDTA